MSKDCDFHWMDNRFDGNGRLPFSVAGATVTEEFFVRSRTIRMTHSCHRLSRMLFPTVKKEQISSDYILSHQLLLRAGFIRQVGLWLISRVLLAVALLIYCRLVIE